MLKLALIGTALLLVAGCTTSNTSNPPRTATEELLISTAAERAAAQLSLAIPAASPTFIDNTNFEGTDSKYAIATIRASLLKKGVRLVDDRKDADVIVETRSGALSTDKNNFLIGIPSFNVPVPFASGTIPFPEIALYGTDDQKGVAKFALTAHDAKQGTLVADQDPQYGFSDKQTTTLLIFISWTENDTLPEAQEAPIPTDLSGVEPVAPPDTSTAPAPQGPRPVEPSPPPRPDGESPNQSQDILKRMP